MSWKNVATCAFLLSNVLGGVCLSDTTYAIPAESDRVTHVSLELAMSPANATSPSACRGCVTLQSPHHTETGVRHGALCNDEHCLSEHAPGMVGASPNMIVRLDAPVGPPALEQPSPFLGLPPARFSPSERRNHIAIATVILRQ